MEKKISIFIILLLLISCKKEVVILKEPVENDLSINIDFPDTVFINKGYDGKINYKNDLDTVTKTLNKLNPLRTIAFTFLKTDEINYSNQHLKKIVTDTFYSESNKTIPFFVKLDNLGIYYIDGIITDEVVIENGGKNSKGELMDRIITNEFRATKKVVVIEKQKK